MIVEIITVMVLASMVVALFVIVLHRFRRDNKQTSTSNPGYTQVGGIDEGGEYTVTHLPINEASSRLTSIDVNSITEAKSGQVDVEPRTSGSGERMKTAAIEASRGRARRREGLRMIHGIGEKREGKLMSIGIRTIEELAKADPKDLAIKLGISERLASTWVGEARMIVSRKDM